MLEKIITQSNVETLFGRQLSARAVARLDAAGSLLQSDSSICMNAEPNESRLDTIYRVISELSPSKKELLKSHVDWVEGYGFDERDTSSLKNFSQVAPHQTGTDRSGKEVDEVNHLLSSLGEGEEADIYRPT